MTRYFKRLFKYFFLPATCGFALSRVYPMTLEKAIAFNKFVDHVFDAIDLAKYAWFKFECLLVEYAHVLMIVVPLLYVCSLIMKVMR